MKPGDRLYEIEWDGGADHAPFRATILEYEVLRVWPRTMTLAHEGGSAWQREHKLPRALIGSRFFESAREAVEHEAKRKQRRIAELYGHIELLRAKMSALATLSQSLGDPEVKP